MAKISLSSKAARVRLPQRAKPYFQSIPGTGVQIGYRTGSETWLVRWWDHGREIQRTLRAHADNYTLANGAKILNFNQAVKAALKRAETAGNIDLERLTVDQVFERYAKSRDGIGKDTRDSQLRNPKSIRPTFQNKQVSRLKKHELVEWRDMVAKNVAPATVNRLLSVFKACLKFGFEELEIPFQGVPPWKALKPLIVVKKARDRFLTPAELTRLANASDPDLRDLVLAAAYTGARFGDLAALRCGDWNPHLQKVRIQNAKTNRPRYVAVHREAAAFFNSLTAHGSQDTEKRLLTRWDGQHWGRNSYRRKLIEASERAKIHPPVNFHMIRHSYASAMKLAGVDDTIIAAALGHSSTRMVQEHYGHLEQSHIDQQIAAHSPKLNVVFNKTNISLLNVE